MSRVTGAVCPLIVKSVALVTSATPLPHVTHCAHRPRPCGHLWGGGIVLAASGLEQNPEAACVHSFIVWTLTEHLLCAAFILVSMSCRAQHGGGGAGEAGVLSGGPSRAGSSCPLQEAGRGQRRRSGPGPRVAQLNCGRFWTCSAACGSFHEPRVRSATVPDTRAGRDFSDRLVPMFPKETSFR